MRGSVVLNAHDFTGLLYNATLTIRILAEKIQPASLQRRFLSSKTFARL
jgi:hypothetical protein